MTLRKVEEEACRAEQREEENRLLKGLTSRIFSAFKEYAQESKQLSYVVVDGPFFLEKLDKRIKSRSPPKSLSAGSYETKYVSVEQDGKVQRGLEISVSYK